MSPSELNQTNLLPLPKTVEPCESSQEGYRAIENLGPMPDIQCEKCGGGMDLVRRASGFYDFNCQGKKDLL